MATVAQASFRAIDQTVFEAPGFKAMNDRQRLAYLDGLVYGTDAAGWRARARRYFRAGPEFQVGTVVGLLVGLVVGCVVTAAYVVKVLP